MGNKNRGWVEMLAIALLLSAFMLFSGCSIGPKRLAGDQEMEKFRGYRSVMYGPCIGGIVTGQDYQNMENTARAECEAENKDYKYMGMLSNPMAIIHYICKERKEREIAVYGMAKPLPVVPTKSKTQGSK